MTSLETSVTSQLNSRLLVEGAEYTVAEECNPHGDSDFIIPVGATIQISDIQSPMEHIVGHIGFFTVTFEGKKILCNFQDAENFLVEC